MSGKEANSPISVWQIIDLPRVGATLQVGLSPHPGLLAGSRPENSCLNGY